MTQRVCQRASFCLLFCGMVATSMQSVVGQTIEGPLDSGFDRSSSISLTVEEMLGTRVSRTDAEPVFGPGFPALWMGEIQYKPVRMLRTNVTDPATGQAATKLIWYMVYRVIPRDYTELAGDEQDDLRAQLQNESRDPQNEVDAVRAPKLMIPRFVLEVTDQGSEARYVDEPNPEIQRAIMRREFRGDAAGLPVVNSIDGIEEVGDPVSVNDPDQLSKAVYGVAIWSDVDSDTDYFKVEMSGFTNAYRLPPGQDAANAEEKVFVQWFGRPGDRFNENEREFRFDDEDHPPRWMYLPREASLEVDPSTLSVLRRGTVDGVTR